MQIELTHAWAIAYKKAGWNVIPAIAKHPIVPWKQLQTAPPSLSQVDEWFTTKDSRLQIALICGQQSNISVVDIDSHRDGCGSKEKKPCDCDPTSPSEILATIPSSPLISHTGNHGFHVFFKNNPKVNNSVKLLHPQMDIRGEGGIIILPPSIHEKTHLQYEWPKDNMWSVKFLNSLPQFPNSLVGLLVNKPKKETNWMKVVSEGASHGSRNATMASLIGKLSLNFKEHELPALWDLLCIYNDARIDPPLSHKELERTFQSILSSEFERRFHE